MRILVIAFYFAPINKIASIRPTKLCKYWIRQGHEVTVLTGDNQSAYPLHDRLLLSEELAQCKIHRTKYISRTNIRNKLFGKDAATADRHVSSWGGASKTATGKPSGWIRTILEWTRNFFNEENASWYWCSKSALRRIMAQDDYDVVFSTFGPINCHRLAMYAKKLKPNVFWIADFRDIFSQNELMKVSRYKRDRMKSTEKKIRHMANLVTCVSTGVMDSLTKLQGKAPVVLATNGFDNEDIKSDEQKEVAGVMDEKFFSFVYTGAAYPPNRDPSAFFEAIKYLADEHHINLPMVKLYYAGGDGAYFKKIAVSYGLDDFVIDCGMLPRSMALSLQRNAGALLILTSNTPENQGILTGKFFEYLFSGKPIVAVITGEVPNSEIADIIRRTGAGVVWEQAKREYDTVNFQNYLEALITGQVDWNKKVELSGIAAYLYPNIAKQFIDMVVAEKDRVVMS